MAFFCLPVASLVQSGPGMSGFDLRHDNLEMDWNQNQNLYLYAQNTTTG